MFAVVIEGLQGHPYCVLADNTVICSESGEVDACSGETRSESRCKDRTCVKYTPC